MSAARQRAPLEPGEVAPLGAPEPTRPALPLWQALLLAAAAGPVLDAAFPDLGWWPLALPGVVMLYVAMLGRRPAAALLVGAVGGFSFYGLHIAWATVYLGFLPWFALTVAQTLFVALGVLLMSIVWRRGPLVWTTRRTRIGVLPVVVAGLWTLREVVASMFPFGGFSWARLAFSQADSPLGDLASSIGASGLSFVIAWFAAFLVQLVREPRSRPLLPPLPLGRTLLAAAIGALLIAVPNWPVAVTGTLRVGGVQGDADSGLYSTVERGTVLRNHLDATAPLLDGDEDLDVLVWPENASDISPQGSGGVRTVLQGVADAVDAPFVLGAITWTGEGDEQEIFNSVLQIDPGEGQVDQYDKIHPVPFAEYLPAREFFYPLAPDLFDMVPRDYTFGTRDNVLDLDGVIAGTAICYDIVDDDLIRRMVGDGAEIIIAPTNNADFGRTDQGAQQLAIARIRSIETGRSLANVSTVGVSAMVEPDGSIVEQLPTFEPGVMVADLPLSDTTTGATMVGRGVEYLVGGVALGGLALVLVVRRPQRR